MDLLSSIIGIGTAIFIGLPWILFLLTPLVLIVAPLIASFFVISRKKAAALSKRRFRVLVADDDKISVTPLLMLLGQKALDVKYVRSGQRALAALRKDLYDIVFLDLSMPDLTGEQTLNKGDRILKNETSIPVIIYSGGEVSKLKLHGKKYRKFKIENIWKKATPLSTLEANLENLLHSSSPPNPPSSPETAAIAS